MKVLSVYHVDVFFSLLGNDVLEADHPQRVGFYGSYGNRWANYSVGRADWLLVLGSRLDIRQTGADVDSFKSGKTIYHVDVDPAEVNNRVQGCHAIAAELSSFVAVAAKEMPGGSLSIDDWYGEISDRRAEWPSAAEYRSEKGINPCSFLHDLSKLGGAACGCASGPPGVPTSPMALVPPGLRAAPPREPR